MNRHDEFLACHRALLAALVAEQANRRSSQGLEWIARERTALATAATGWARQYDRAPVTVDQIEAIEHQAMGHIDYSSKLALYVAELVYR